MALTPSQKRYEERNPTVSFRVDRDTYDRIKELQRKSGKSIVQLVKEALGFVERSTEEAYRKGFEEGYSQARDRYKFTIPCADCGRELVLSDNAGGIDKVKQLLKGFTHSQCPETKGEEVSDDEQGH